MNTAGLNRLEAIFLEIRLRAIAARTSIESAENKLDALNSVNADLEEAIQLADSIVNQLSSPREANLTVNRKTEELKEATTTILVENLLDGIEFSDEYSREPFKSRLIQVCSDPASIQVKLNKQGWNSRIDVIVNLDETAGTLDEWGSAVSQVRDNHGWGFDAAGNPVDPIKSSQIWKNSIYPDELGDWANTIEERLSLVESIAPFWRLVNYGSMQTLSSDRGGFSYPKLAPVKFVEKTITQLETEFQNFIKLAEQEFINYETKAQKILQDLVEYRRNTLLDIESLRRAIYTTVERYFSNQPISTSVTDFDEIYDKVIDEKEVVIEKMANRVGKSELAHNKRFASLVLDLLEFDGKIIRSRITKDGRVEITESGGVRTRISVRKLRKLFQGL